MTDARLLTNALRDPASTAGLDPRGWTALLAIARAEQLIGTLAHRLDGLPKPEAAARILADARAAHEQGRVAALWEAEMARRALAGLDIPVVLLKGTAFVAAGLSAGTGRQIGDLDILVPRARIGEAETALLAAGWEWVKPDPYDDEYYRRWMHELPPLIHRERDRMIDVHHTILPLTATITPDAAGLIAQSQPLSSVRFERSREAGVSTSLETNGEEGGLRILTPNDMLCHAAAHLFADGDLAGGLRNLWDVHCLIGEFGTEGLAERAAHHGLSSAMGRALRLSEALYSPSPLQGRGPGRGALSTSDAFAAQAPLPDPLPASGEREFADRLYLRRLLARDGWGRQTRKLTRFAFYLRSHAIRMPPAMLARHLWTKYRKGYRPA